MKGKYLCGCEVDIPKGSVVDMDFNCRCYDCWCSDVESIINIDSDLGMPDIVDERGDELRVFNARLIRMGMFYIKKEFCIFLDKCDNSDVRKILSDYESMIDDFVGSKVDTSWWLTDGLGIYDKLLYLCKRLESCLGASD